MEEREPGPWPHASNSGLPPGGHSARTAGASRLREEPIAPWTKASLPSPQTVETAEAEHGGQVPPPTTLLPQGGAEAPQGRRDSHHMGTGKRPNPHQASPSSVLPCRTVFRIVKVLPSPETSKQV